MTAVLEDAGLHSSCSGRRYDNGGCILIQNISVPNTVPKGEGAMAAVIGAETELIEKCLAPIEDVSIANYNCPGQIVITGKKSAVEQAVEALKQPVSEDALCSMSADRSIHR